MQCRPAGLMRYAAPPCRPKRPTTAPASRAQLWVFSTQPIFWNRNATRMSVLITSQKWGQECLTSVVRWFRRNSFHLNHLDKGRPDNTTFRPLDSLQVMAYIVDMCRKQHIEVNVTKLQKLLYCCYGVALAQLGIRLTKESPQAWQYGPVFPKTLEYFRKHPIESLTDSSVLESTASDELKKLLIGTLTYFGQFSASQLSTWSHQIGSPWYRSSNGGANLREEIDDTSIKCYFRNEVLA